MRTDNMSKVENDSRQMMPTKCWKMRNKWTRGEPCNSAEGII